MTQILNLSFIIQGIWETSSLTYVWISTYNFITEKTSLHFSVKFIIGTIVKHEWNPFCIRRVFNPEASCTVVLHHFILVETKSNYELWIIKVWTLV